MAIWKRAARARLMRTFAYETEEIPATGARCVISNRMAYGLSALNMGAFSLAEEGDRATTLSDTSLPPSR